MRRALSLALDRWAGSKALSRIAVVKDVAGIQVPGTPGATWRQIGVNVKQVVLESASWLQA